MKTYFLNFGCKNFIILKFFKYLKQKFLLKGILNKNYKYKLND